MTKRIKDELDRDFEKPKYWAQVNGEAIKATELCRSRRREKMIMTFATLQNQQPLLQIYNLKT